MFGTYLSPQRIFHEGKSLGISEAFWFSTLVECGLGSSMVKMSGNLLYRSLATVLDMSKLYGNSVGPKSYSPREILICPLYSLSLNHTTSDIQAYVLTNLSSA